MGERGHEPPQTVTLDWCPECGQTDRFTALRTRHRPPYSSRAARRRGGLCAGVLTRVTYVLYMPPAPVTEGDE